MSRVEIDETDLRIRSDIDQPPETVDEIIEIVGDHYHAAIAEGYQDPQDDALESDDEEIVTISRSSEVQARWKALPKR